MKSLERFGRCSDAVHNPKVGRICYPTQMAVSKSDLLEKCPAVTHLYRD